MGKYLYWPVSGAGVVWREAYSFAKAKDALLELRKKWPKIEVERVLLVGNGRRYWRWRDGKWSANDRYDPTPADLAHWASTG